tara:strand:+ start:6024 stop:6200 length:177 start_codon:yes stop_codon:yes gene_type:complete
MANTRDMIDSLHKGDNLEAEKAFNDIMSSKVGSSLEAKRVEVANTFVKTPAEGEEDDF